MNMKYVIAILPISSYISLIFISDEITNLGTLATEDTGRGLEKGNRVAYEFWKCYPYRTHEELYADTSQSKVYAHYNHQSRSLVSGWSLVHGLDGIIKWWYSTVNIQ